MSPHAPEVYLGRQPILDRLFHVVAYELLFRSGSLGEAMVDDDSAATAQVIRQAFRQMGIRTVVGDCVAFINVDAPTLFSRAVEALPKERVVIELLETIAIDDDIVRRCRELKAQGYRLALDDFVRYEEAYEPLLDIVDIVKIDVLQLAPEYLARLVKRLRPWPPQLLAEKVETRQGARACQALGFTLFQGFYFGRPAMLAV
jgi:c-di-GMP-related signal transduction protein